MHGMLITTLITGAVLLMIGGRLSQRLMGREAVGSAIVLALISFAVIITPNNYLMWLIGGDGGDRLLSFSRDLGLTGLLFFAGTKFDTKAISTNSQLVLGVAVSNIAFGICAAILLATIGGQDLRIALLVASAVAATSLWLPRNSNDKAASTVPCAAVIAAILFGLILHFSSVFQSLSGKSVSLSIYSIVLIYELIKIIMFFALAYFIVSRFIARAEGRIPDVRLTIGLLILCALIFVLAVLAIGHIAAFVWAFAAGTMITRSKAAKKFNEDSTPIAGAIFLSFIFLSIFLQNHGRAVESILALLATIGITLFAKALALWAGAKIGGASSRNAGLIAVGSVPSLEIGVLFLGFGISRWPIAGPGYYGIIGFALISTIFGEIASYRIASSNDRSSELNSASKTKKHKNQKKILAVTSILTVVFSLSSATNAQTQSSTDDSVRKVNANDVGPSGLPKDVEAMLSSLNKKVTREADGSELLMKAEYLYREG